MKAGSRLTWAGVLRFCRQGSAIQCTVVAGSLGADWLPANPANPGARVARQLAEQRSALAGHWIFGGTGRPDGQAKLTFEGAGAWVTTLQIFNPGPDEAIVTFTPSEESLPGFVATALGHSVLRTLELAGTLFYALKADDLSPLFIADELLALCGSDLDRLRATPSAWYSCLLPDSQKEAQEATALVRKQGSCTRTYRLRDPAGRIHTLKDQAVLLPSHVPPLIIGCVVDYTPFTAVDDRARKLQHGIEKSREGFALTDAAGCFTYVNPEHLVMFGFKDQSELLGQSWEILYSPESVARIQTEVFPALQSQGHWHGVVPARRKDGVIFSEDLTLSILPDGGIACNCRDRSSEVVLHERLAASETLFRSFVDHVPAAVTIKQANGQCIFLNRHGSDMLGISQESMIGRRADEVVPHDAKQIEKADSEVLRTAKAVNQLGVFHRPEGDMELEVVKFPIFDHAGQVQQIGGIYLDVTQRRRLEREAAEFAGHQGELLIMQREFMSMISHEFRTPLTAIQGAHYLLRKRIDQANDEKVTRYFDLQAESIQALKELVDQVLFLNRLEYSMGELELKPLPVAELITSIVTRFNDTTLTADPRLQLTCTVAPDLTLNADESLLSAAFENLISNAIKYSPSATKVFIHVAIVEGQLAFTISDKGRGIPQKQQAKVFSAFFRASNVGVTPGTGLGLAIVKRAVDSHHGRIEFHSAEGTGTTFQLYFPLHQPAAGAKSNP